MHDKAYVLSVVIPCFNESENIPILTKELENVLLDIDYEIILVDDGSSDNSILVYQLLASVNSRIKYIHLSRNFGHQIALKAGIDHSRGDAVITMDADLQHPTSVLPLLIDKWLKGAYVVEAIPDLIETRNITKKLLSSFYYKLVSYLSDQPVRKGANDFRLMDKKLVNILRNGIERTVYLRGMFNWIGFKSEVVYYKQDIRRNGQTKYSLRKMLSLAINGITATSIKPLRLSSLLGLVFSMLGFCFIIYALYISLFTDKAVVGWASVIICVLFFSGLQMFMLGIIGEYLGKLFMENKRRPSYLIDSTNIPSTGMPTQL
jgi:dolichol-phosphate mannosyltransferase